MSLGRRLLGVDFGTVRVGLAVSDADRRLASPFSTHVRKDVEHDARFFRQLVLDQEIGQIVVGLPVHLDGREGASALAARQFGAWLAEVTGLPVIYFDERFTTHQAETALWEAGLTHKKRKSRLDQVAAQMLLQAFIEAGCPERPEAGPLDG